ncbi:MAG: DUF1298 domain-containing protein [Nonomuraea sp.]|nr:DUF1298 domain-containing protein [Nonomuraea sp.]
MNLVDRHFITQDRRQGAATFGFLARLHGVPPSRDELEALVTARLGPIPRLRCGWEGRHWVTEAEPDAGEHVAMHATGSPLDSAAALLGERIDPARPPWRLDLLAGYSANEFALLLRCHHALLDGVSASLVLRHLLGSGGPPYADWGREPATSPQRPTWRNLLGMVTALAERPGRALPFNGPLGPGRQLAVVTVPRATVEAARTPPQTLNDVYLAAVAGAIRRLGWPDLPRAAFALAPVSLRTAASSHVLGNQLAMIRVRLPLHVSSPAARLAAVNTRTTRAKRLSQAGGLALVTQAAAALGVAGQVGLMRLIWLPLMSNVVCSNVPIPAEPLTLAGRPVAGITGVTVLQPRHGLCMMLHGYGMAVTVGILADDRHAEYASKLAGALEQEFHDLAADL